MEVVVDNVVVHGNTCVGCHKYKKDIMVSVVEDHYSIIIHDLFFTTEQALEVAHSLLGSINTNNEEA